MQETDLYLKSPNSYLRRLGEMSRLHCPEEAKEVLALETLSNQLLGTA